MKVLSIRQPWAEFIIRGLRNEFRRKRTNFRGRVHIYLGKANGIRLDAMEEKNEEFGTDLDLPALPRQVLIGTVEIVDCIEHGDNDFEWVMSAPKRLKQHLKVTGRPGPGFWNATPVSPAK